MDDAHPTSFRIHHDAPEGRLLEVAQKFCELQYFLSFSCGAHIARYDPIDSLYGIAADQNTGFRWMVTSNPQSAVGSYAWLKAKQIGAVGIIGLSNPDDPEVCVDPETEDGLVVGQWVSIRGLPAGWSRDLRLVWRNRSVTLALVPSPTDSSTSGQEEQPREPRGPQEPPERHETGMCRTYPELPSSSSYLDECDSCEDDPYADDEREDQEARVPGEEDELSILSDTNASATEQEVHLVGWVNYCGLRDDYSRGKGCVGHSRGRCGNIRLCLECKEEDRRRWLQHVLAVTDGCQVHSTVVPGDKYQSWKRAVERAALDYVAIDQGSTFLAVLSGQLLIGKAKVLATTPVTDAYALIELLEKAFAYEPPKCRRIRSSQPWARDRRREQKEPGESLPKLKLRKGTETREELARQLEALGVEHDPHSRSGTTTITDEQFAQAVEAGLFKLTDSHQGKKAKRAERRLAHVVDVQKRFPGMFDARALSDYVRIDNAPETPAPQVNASWYDGPKAEGHWAVSCNVFQHRLGALPKKEFVFDTLQPARPEPSQADLDAREADLERNEGHERHNFDVDPGRDGTQQAE